jgi:hypothetical protein
MTNKELLEQVEQARQRVLENYDRLPESQKTFDPNAPETEEGAARAGVLRHLRVLQTLKDAARSKK